MADTCDICRGSRTVKLPVYPPLPSPVYTGARCEPTGISETWREFPCPNCMSPASDDRIAVLQHSTEHRGHPKQLADLGFREAVQRDAGRAMISRLIDSGHIKFEWRTDNRDPLPSVAAVRATLAVVAPTVVATLEERIAERQVDVANEVVHVAGQQINLWGSARGDLRIDKDEAHRILSRAMKDVLKWRNTWSAPHEAHR